MWVWFGLVWSEAPAFPRETVSLSPTGQSNVNGPIQRPPLVQPRISPLSKVRSWLNGQSSGLIDWRSRVQFPAVCKKKAPPPSSLRAVSECGATVMVPNTGLVDTFDGIYVQPLQLLLGPFMQFDRIEYC